MSLPDIEIGSDRWPDFCATARDQGIHSVYVIPLRLRETTIGTLNLMRNRRGELNGYDIRAAQALADVATIGILQERRVREASDVRDQLQKALIGRIVIEQAKGVVSETSKVSMEEAFQRIRHHALAEKTTLISVAQRLVEGGLRL